MTPREKIVAEAMEWIGTPFHHEACIKGHGVDCLQLLVGVFKNTGLGPDEIKMEPYAFDEHLHDSDERYIRALEDHGGFRVDEPQPGDVALFRIGRRYSHAAIVIQWPLCIHAYIRQSVSYVDAEQDAALKRRDRLFYSFVRGTE